ncbi:MAG: cytochrome c family protein [Alphaproteobacteria bacterium]|nr:cytochrome c family protein [Alphaproteobacteria bacterium]
MSLELNKIAGAVLMSGMVAMAAGFIARALVHPVPLAENVYKVAGVPAAGTKDTKGGPAAIEPIAPLLAAAKAEEGEKKVKACAACHTFDKGGANRVGPNLWNTIGEKKAGHSGFAYSKQMVEKGGEWTYEELNQFLANPKAFVPGTKMAFAGLSKPQDRADVIAYMRGRADSPKPLP